MDLFGSKEEEDDDDDEKEEEEQSLDKHIRPLSLSPSITSSLPTLKLIPN
jgi:hypothetical protein